MYKKLNTNTSKAELTCSSHSLQTMAICLQSISMLLHTSVSRNVFGGTLAIGYLLDVFIKLWIPSMVYFHLLGASTGNWSQSFINPFSLGSRPWTHPSGLSNQGMLRTKSCLNCWKWSSYKVKAFSTPICTSKWPTCH